MADIRIVAEVVGANKVNALVNSTKKLESQVKNLGNAYLSGKIGPEQFNKGLTELRKSANALYPTHQKASAVVTKLAKDYITLTKAQQQEAAATKAYVQARREAIAMNQRFNQEKKLEELRVKQATQSLNAYTVASRASSVAQQAATKGNNQLGVVVQQTGYQVGDFLVQIQSGTNPMVAFGQQATQLVGVLPLMAGSLGMTTAAAIGLSTALGIGIPLLTAIGAAFMRSRESAEDAAGGIETLEDRLKSAKNATSSLSAEIERLNMRFKDTAEQAFSNAVKETTDAITEIQGKLNTLFDDGPKRGSSNVARGYREEIAALNELLSARRIDLETYIQTRAELARIKELEENRIASVKLFFEYAQRDLQLATERRKAVDAIRAAVDGELKSLGDQIALNNEILKFGKDSVEVATLRAAQEREAYRQQQISNDIVGNKLTLVMAEYDVYVKTTEQLSASEDKAKGLGAALRDAASAMSSLQGFSDGLDKALAVSVAKVEALKRGSDAVIAGQIAGRRVDLESRIDATVASGVDRGIVERMFGGDRDKISQIEASETQRKALEEAQREADRAAKKADKDSPLEKLQKELDLQRELVGQSEAYVKVRQALGDDYAKTSPKIISDLQAQYAETQKLIEIEEQRQSIIGKVESSMESALMSIVDGTKSVKDAFRSMAAEIIKELYRIFVVKRITGMIAGTIGDASSMAGGNFFSGIAGKPVAQAMGGAWMKGVQMFANGGVVDSPTMFGHSGGVGVMGEAGPEAIMPLKRGANGKLGVSVEGGSGSVVVNNNINVTGGSDPAAIRMEVAKLMPQITSATKSAVIDARRRGGQMRAAFN